VQGALGNVERRDASRSAEVLRLVSIDPIHLNSFPTNSLAACASAHDRDVAFFTPDLIVMDEPTRPRRRGSALSYATDQELQNRLGFAVIFVTHDISLVRHFSDRLMVMYAGQVSNSASRQLSLRHLATPTLAPCLSLPFYRGEKIPLTGIAGLHRIPYASAGCRFQPRCRCLPECSVIEPPIYEVGGLRFAACCIEMRLTRREAWRANKPSSGRKCRSRGRSLGARRCPSRQFDRATGNRQCWGRAA